MIKHVTYPGEEISASDLREIRDRLQPQAQVIEWGLWQRIKPDGYLESIYNQYLYIDGRIGIVEGGDSDWADAESVDEGIETYLNDPDKWDARR